MTNNGLTIKSVLSLLKNKRFGEYLTMKRSIAFLALLLAVSSLALTACGGGGETPTTEPSPAESPAQ